MSPARKFIHHVAVESLDLADRADGTLLAQPFDARRLSLDPNIEPVAKPVRWPVQLRRIQRSPQGTITYEEGSGSSKSLT